MSTRPEATEALATLAREMEGGGVRHAQTERLVVKIERMLVTSGCTHAETFLILSTLFRSLVDTLPTERRPTLLAMLMRVIDLDAGEA